MLQPIQWNSDTRDLILKEALARFTERGYFNTSIHDIQRGAGVSIGSIYHHFKGKDDIAQALYDTLLVRMDAAVCAAIESSSTARGQCRAIIALLLEATEADPQTMQFILYARHQEFLPTQTPVCSSLPFQRLHQLVERGMACGEIRSIDPWIATAVLFGGAIRLIQLKLDGAIDAPLLGYLDELSEAAWRAVAV